ncbi:hypothetical protein R0J90_19680, partial [Micrococcus sp. SIMBA_144]
MVSLLRAGQAGVVLSGDMHPDLALVLFRLGAVAGVALITVFAPVLARRLGGDGARGRLISGSNAPASSVCA